MTDGKRDRTWTLLLLRGGGGRVFEWTGRRRVATAALAAALLVAVGLGTGVGLAWGEYRESRRVAELRERVRSLQEDRARVRLLAARLDSVEEEYRQIRRIMSREDGASEGDVVLPPAPAENGDARPAAAGGGASGDGWGWPLSQKGFVTRTHREGNGEGDGEHQGLDVAVPVGSYVRAARNGEVAAAGEDPVYGLFVRLRHADGATSLYGHNRWLFVSSGDSVERGEVIALSGNSGRSTAPHLHFEVTRAGTSVDPARLLGDELPREALPVTSGGGP